MIFNKLISTRKKFWTVPRLMLTVLAATLTLVVASSCTSNDISTETANSANKPKVTISSSSPSRQTPPPPANGTVAADMLAPDVMNAEITDTTGQTFKLSDYQDRVVVLDLWATWCGPCKAEIPHLVELNADYGAKGVEVIGLTTEDPQSDGQKVQDFVKAYKINYRVGWAGRDVAVALMRGNYSIPQTFVIAPGGRVVAHYLGYAETVPAMIRAAIDRAKETNGD